ncbi:MAG: hypothetical protein Q8P67_06750 [archaeon]|nr:hypothetical protein [archaeon]
MPSSQAFERKYGRRSWVLRQKLAHFLHDCTLGIGNPNWPMESVRRERAKNIGEAFFAIIFPGSPKWVGVFWYSIVLNPFYLAIKKTEQGCFWQEALFLFLVKTNSIKGFLFAFSPNGRGEPLFHFFKYHGYCTTGGPRIQAIISTLTLSTPVVLPAIV